jgi:hypothetical protein
MKFARKKRKSEVSNTEKNQEQVQDLQHRGTKDAEELRKGNQPNGGSRSRAKAKPNPRGKAGGRAQVRRDTKDYF